MGLFTGETEKKTTRYPFIDVETTTEKPSKLDEWVNGAKPKETSEIKANGHTHAALGILGNIFWGR